MRKLLKKVSMLLCICLVAIPLISCGNNGNDNGSGNAGSGNTNSSKVKESTPEEAAKTYLDIYKRGKDIKYDNIGAKEEDLKELANKRDYNLSLILMIGNEQKADKDFWKSIYSCLEKVEVEVKNADVKDNKASVEIVSKPMDLENIHVNAVMNTKKKGREKQTGDKKSSDIYMEFLKEELANSQPGEEKSCTINMEKNADGKWILSEDSIGTLESAITSDKSYEVYKDDLTDDFKEIINNI